MEPPGDKTEGEEVAAKNWSATDVALAQEILRNRPGFRESSLPPKGGVKYADKFDSVAEARKLEAYYDTLKKAYSSLKVAKLGNLGTAQWLPQHGVAKVTKQGKFMQTKCHYHEKGFFALYPEEALFLLDVGEIELLYNGVPMSMHSAYAMLLCEVPESKLSTVDEYQVYAHLTKLGYRVQRYVGKGLGTSPEAPCGSNNKRLKSAKEHNGLQPNKALKSHASTKSQPCSSNGSHEWKFQSAERSVNEMKRPGWWITKNESLQHTETSSNSIEPLSQNIAFLDFGQSGSELFSQKWDKSLLPPNTALEYQPLPIIWHQRINRHDDGESSNRTHPGDFSHPKRLNFEKIRSTAKCWEHYNRMMLGDKIELHERQVDLCEKMHSGNVAPLLHPSDANTTANVLDKIKIRTLPAEQTKASCITEPLIRFNVFQTDKSKPFKKTQPGKPFLRVVVLTSASEVPELCDLLSLDHLSPTVPVKYAVVDFGKVLFFACESISIPVDVNLG